MSLLRIGMLVRITRCCPELSADQDGCAEQAERTYQLNDPWFAVGNDGEWYAAMSGPSLRWPRSCATRRA